MERMIDRLQAEEQRRRRMKNAADDEPDQVEIMTNMERLSNINASRSVFDRTAEATFGGINTQKSVFDRQAIFHVGNGEDQEV